MSSTFSVFLIFHDSNHNYYHWQRLSDLFNRSRLLLLNIRGDDPRLHASFRTLEADDVGHAHVVGVVRPDVEHAAKEVVSGCVLGFFGL
ncbi:hypothetical protein BC936DRAFT_140939, partial [Jimgerdemannia flammicorona]